MKYPLKPRRGDIIIAREHEIPIKTPWGDIILEGDIIL
jgi:hypothetical protein